MSKYMEVRLPDIVPEKHSLSGEVLSRPHGGDSRSPIPPGIQISVDAYSVQRRHGMAQGAPNRKRETPRERL